LSILMDTAAASSKTFVYICQPTLRHFTEDHKLDIAVVPQSRNECFVVGCVPLK